MAGDLSLANILSKIDLAIQERRSTQQFQRLLNTSKYELRAYFRGHCGSEAVALALTVKVLNLFLGKHHFLARDLALSSKPFGIIVDPVNNCNLACPGCVHSSRSRELRLFDWKGGMLSEDRYDALLKRFGPYALQLTLYSYGEPLLNPNTPAFIRKAKSYLIRTMLSTNMTVKRFDPDAYVNSGLDFMTVSIDGASQAVYEKFRRNGNLETALRNIERLVDARRRHGRPNPVINWQYLAFEHNAHEIDAALELARSMGVDQFTVATPFDVSWDDPNIRPAAVQTVSHAFLEDNTERIIANWNPFPAELNQNAFRDAFESDWPSSAPVHQGGSPRAGHTCHYLYKNMVLDANSRVLPCCAAPTANADLVFSIFDAGTADPFNSEKYQQARLSFSDRAKYELAASRSGSAPHCAKCEWHSDQKMAHIDRSQVGTYLDAAGPDLFDAISRSLLTSW